MKKFAWILGLCALGTAVLNADGVASAQNKPAAPAPATATMPYHELSAGNPKAKVTVIEFASLTCPHCAEFQQVTFPALKKNYIDTGKIRYVYKDYPLDELAMVGAVLARCAPANRGLELIDTLFKNQVEWGRAEQPIVPLKSYAQHVGLSGADVDACLQNKGLLQAVKDEQDKAATLYQVNATPTFYVGNEKVEGAYPYDDLAKIIDSQIAKTK